MGVSAQNLTPNLLLLTPEKLLSIMHSRPAMRSAATTGGNKRSGGEAREEAGRSPMVVGGGFVRGFECEIETRLRQVLHTRRPVKGQA